MQTFILSTDIEQSAMWLDSKRLNKQITEAMQIYKANFEDGPKQGNPHAYTMWLDHPDFLIEYGCIHYQEWQRRLRDGKRGGKLNHKSGEEFFALGWLNANMNWDHIVLDNPPAWLTEEFASNHRSIMLGKVVEACKKSENDMIAFADTDFSKYEKARRRNTKSALQWQWYQQWDWLEEPAQRNSEGKWPYLWPEVV